jgi:hypothetical protein
MYLFRHHISKKFDKKKILSTIPPVGSEMSQGDQTTMIFELSLARPLAYYGGLC